MSTEITSDYINEHLIAGNIVLASARLVFEKTPYAPAFKVAQWKENNKIIDDWVMCVKCEEWIKIKKRNGTNILTRHMNKCGFDGYAFLEPENLARLVANCIRLGGLKVKTDELKNTFKDYPVITKHVM